MPIVQECRAFTTRYTGLVSRIITDVKITAAYDPANPPSNIHFYETKAMWDTGATASVITAGTAKALNLTPTGTRLVHHAGGKGHFNSHVANFFLPNMVAIAGVLVSECGDPHDGHFGAIIGMDIIGGGDLTITNHKGKTMVSFRYPSYAPVDYVADINSENRRLASHAKVGRNDPCPCGSNIKFKKCHGKIA
jgi:hypothetical protein